MKFQVDLRPFMPPIRDQGPRGTCLAFAITGAHEYARFLKTNALIDLSEETLYWKGRTVAGLPNGMTFAAAVQAIYDQGQPEEYHWPYEPARDENDASYSPPPDALQPSHCFKAILHKIDMTIKSVTKALDQKIPVIAGVTMSVPFLAAPNGIIAVPTPSEMIQQGHAILLVGYADPQGPETEGYFLTQVAHDWQPLKPTEAFATYWRFAAARQRLFFRRLHGQLPPWSDDPILANFRFTNAYRASDRVSQYLIRQVIYPESGGSRLSPEDNIFRILLFKIFNRIATWQLLEKETGEISWENYSFSLFDNLLTETMKQGGRIFSPAYIMPSGQTSFGEAKKHRNYLLLLEKMIREDVAERLLCCQSLKEVYVIIRSYPLMGDFLAFQYTIDLNYWAQLNFDESEFVVAGPGARDGIAKCFTNSEICRPEEIIRFMTDKQEIEFARLEIEFPSLWGRRLQMIDCQNLFCEVSKYARIAHPNIRGISGRSRIKQVYRVAQQTPLSEPYYLPSWGLNAKVQSEIITIPT